MHQDDYNLAEEVGQHAEFVRVLAARLIRDPDAADDVAQESMMAAMRSPRPQSIVSIRGWLTGVVKNHALRHFRRESKRRDKEANTAQVIETEVPAETLARLEMRQRLVAMVSRLEEPYRAVILLRYMDSQTPTEIGAQLGRSVSTVKTQLQRGLAKLRASLDAQEGGDRRAWILALAPIASPELLATGKILAAHSSNMTSVGGTSVGKMAVWKIVAISFTVVVASGLGIWRSGLLESDDESYQLSSLAEDAGERTIARKKKNFEVDRSVESRVSADPGRRPDSDDVFGLADKKGEEIRRTIQGRTKIVDGETGLPIAGARLHQYEEFLSREQTFDGLETLFKLPKYLTSKLSMPGETPLVATSDNDGFLLIDRNDPEDAHWLISKPGFQTRKLGPEFREIMPKEVPLRPAGTLVVRRPNQAKGMIVLELTNDQDAVCLGEMKASESQVMFDDLRPGRWFLSARPMPINSTDVKSDFSETGLLYESSVHVQARKSTVLELAAPLRSRDVVVKFDRSLFNTEKLRLSLIRESDTTRPSVPSVAVWDGDVFRFSHMPLGFYTLRLSQQLKTGFEVISALSVTVKAGVNPQIVDLKIPRGELHVDFLESEKSKSPSWNLTLSCAGIRRHLTHEGGRKWHTHCLERGTWMLVATSANQMFCQEIVIEDRKHYATLTPPRLRRLTIKGTVGRRIELELEGVSSEPQKLRENAEEKTAECEFRVGPGHYHVLNSSELRGLDWICIEMKGDDEKVNLDDAASILLTVELRRTGQPLPWTEFSLKWRPLAHPNDPLYDLGKFETDLRGRAELPFWSVNGHLILVTEQGDQVELRVDQESFQKASTPIPIEIP